MHRRIAIVAMVIMAGLLAIDARGQDATTPISDRIDALLAPLYPHGQPGAVVLVAQGGRIVHDRAYGSANLELDVPMTTDSVFRVASVTKLFTAVAVLLLMEDGKLELEDDLHRLLPDFPTHGQAITLRDLLTHASGIHDYLDRPDAADWIRNELTLDQLVGVCGERELDFAPGTAAAYSNSNYAILAAVIEKASGQPYAEFLRERIFTPAGMAHTQCGDDRRIVPGRADGYAADDDGELLNERYYSLTILRGCGDVLSTAPDLHRFFAALFDGELIGEATLARSLDPGRLEDGRRTRFGIGWELDQVGRHRAALKGAAISGFGHYVGVLPDDGVEVILLTNRAPDETHRPGKLLMRIAAIVVDG